MDTHTYRHVRALLVQVTAMHTTIIQVCVDSPLQQLYTSIVYMYIMQDLRI